MKDFSRVHGYEKNGTNNQLDQSMINSFLDLVSASKQLHEKFYLQPRYQTKHDASLSSYKFNDGIKKLPGHSPCSVLLQCQGNFLKACRGQIDQSVVKIEVRFNQRLSRCIFIKQLGSQIDKWLSYGYFKYLTSEVEVRQRSEMIFKGRYIQRLSICTSMQNFMTIAQKLAELWSFKLLNVGNVQT